MFFRVCILLATLAMPALASTLRAETQYLCAQLVKEAQNERVKSHDWYATAILRSLYAPIVVLGSSIGLARQPSRPSLEDWSDYLDSAVARIFRTLPLEAQKEAFDIYFDEKYVVYSNKMVRANIAAAHLNLDAIVSGAPDTDPKLFLRESLGRIVIFRKLVLAEEAIRIAMKRHFAFEFTEHTHEIPIASGKPRAFFLEMVVITLASEIHSVIPPEIAALDLLPLADDPSAQWLWEDYKVRIQQNIGWQIRHSETQVPNLLLSGYLDWLHSLR